MTKSTLNGENYYLMSSTATWYNSRTGKKVSFETSSKLFKMIGIII